MPSQLMLGDLKAFRKRVAFSNAAGAGAIGTVKVADVDGAVLIVYGAARCLADLAGASATVELGVPGNTAALIAQTTATDIDDGEFWQDSTPELGVSPAITNRAVEGDINVTVATANLTAGVIEFTFYWLPLSDDARMF